MVFTTIPLPLMTEAEKVNTQPTKNRYDVSVSSVAEALTRDGVIIIEHTLLHM